MHPVLVNLVLVNLNLCDNVKKYSYTECVTQSKRAYCSQPSAPQATGNSPPPTLPLTTSLLGAKYSSSGKQEAFCFPIIL